MNEAKHTPGPWRCDQLREQRTGRRAVTAAGQLNPVALVHNGDDHAEADARLIAAAPDLLASLVEFREHLIKGAAFGINDEERAMLRRADAAIASATGEG